MTVPRPPSGPLSDAQLAEIDDVLCHAKSGDPRWELIAEPLWFEVERLREGIRERGSCLTDPASNQQRYEQAQMAIRTALDALELAVRQVAALVPYEPRAFTTEQLALLMDVVAGDLRLTLPGMTWQEDRRIEQLRELLRILETALEGRGGTNDA